MVRSSGLLLLLTLLAALVPGAGAAAPGDACAQRPVDLVLVLDDSGSMHRNDDEHSDPDNLRITAAHLIVDLLDPGDQAGLVLFSDDLRQVLPLAPLSQTRDRLHAGIDAFASQGGTRLDRALEQGLGMFARPDPDRTRAILFLTDGRPGEQAEAQEARLLALARQAREQQVSLYVIGLGIGYHRALLDDLTTVSQSQQLWPVTAPADLSRAFLEILRDLKGLNIEASTTGAVPVLGYGDKVRFAALRPRSHAPVEALWDGGRAVSRGEMPSDRANVSYGYDVLVYEPTLRQPGSAHLGADVVWKVERTPVAASVVQPASRQTLPAGEGVPVRVELSPCSGEVPPGLRAAVEVLDANRQATSHAADLRFDAGDPRTLSGQLTMPPEAGTYVLRARILTADGQQVTVAEQTVSSQPPPPPREPPAATAGAQVGPPEPLPWWYLILAAALAAGAWRVAHQRLTSGPQLRLALGAGDGPLHSLAKARPGWLARLWNTKSQRVLEVGGVNSRARLKIPELPAEAHLQVEARGAPGRERYRIRNRNPAVPLYDGGWQKSQVVLRGDRPQPKLTIGDIPLHLAEQAEGRRQRTRR